MISIVIRAKNEHRFLGDVLRLILAQDDTEEREIVVIDSGSTDGTKELARTFPVRLCEIPADKFTFGYALNYGANQARGRIIVYLSAHCTPTTHSWLRGLVEPLRRDKQLKATYGRQEPRKGVNPFEEQGLRAAFPTNGSQPTFALFSNANCAIWRSVLEKHPFDEQITFAEDLVWRLQFDARDIQYVPMASVYHSHPLALKYWAHRFELDGIATVRMFREYGIINPYTRQSDDLTTTVRDFLEGCRQHIKFFLFHGYYRFLPAIPFFEATRTFFFSRGLRKGRSEGRYGLPEAGATNAAMARRRNGKAPHPLQPK